LLKIAISYYELDKKEKAFNVLNNLFKKYPFSPVTKIGKQKFEEWN